MVSLIYRVKNLKIIIFWIVLILFLLSSNFLTLSSNPSSDFTPEQTVTDPDHLPRADPQEEVSFSVDYSLTESELIHMKRSPERKFRLLGDRTTPNPILMSSSNKEEIPNFKEWTTDHINPQKLSGLQSFTSHSPIVIANNGDFATQAGSEGWAGNGTTINPYVISNYLINSSGASGILIANTTVHFRISNVFIDGATNSSTGAFQFTNVSHGIVEDSFATNSWHGFYMNSTSNNILFNNTATSNYYGFYLYNSSNNTLTNNTATNNGYDGFHLFDSISNTLTNNTATHNDYGFIMRDSSNSITLTNNTATSNALHGFYLWDSSNNVLMNNTATSNVLHGFSLYNSSNNVLMNNTATSNGHSFYLFD
ncbi:MAG: right-handed parallel beta-helix repeat-containing protein, partial [Candidatus Hodarchaeales archaeon]